MSSDQVEAINAASGERCNPHPHNFSDRIIRPGNQAVFDITQSYNGYRSCYYWTFGVGSATLLQYDAYTNTRLIPRRGGGRTRRSPPWGPKVGTDRAARTWPKVTEFGFTDEMAALGLQIGRGLGLGLHKRLIISRLHSLDNSVEIQKGIVAALETYCPALDGFSASRIEEEVVVTSTGAQVLTIFPAQDLFVANRY